MTNKNNFIAALKNNRRMKKLLLIISIITFSNVIVFSQEIESGRTNGAIPSNIIPVVNSVPELNKLESN
jgi:hypothetical protein